MRGWRVLLFSGVVLTIRGAELMPDAMMCELLAKPGRVAVTDATPELSWGFKGGEPGDYQTAYRIQVAKTTEQLTTNKQGHVFVDFGKAAFGGLEWIPPAGSDAGPLVVHLGEKAKGHLVKICG